MKLADAFQSFLGKKRGQDETYLSLFLDDHIIAASFWRPGAKGTIEKIATSHKTIESQQWTDRIVAIDAILGLLEEKTKLSDVTRTILGLSSSFLTATGEIPKDIRAEIKKLASELDLTIAGFVPLSQALIYKLKSDEGVPPSVILLGISQSTIAVSLYKIGALVGVRDIEKHKEVASELELGLKSFTEMEVLPARILLHGSDVSELEEVKTKLLHHPWTTKANFLHFPKIAVVSVDASIDAISLAGASEMKSEMPQEPESEVPPKEEEQEREGDEETLEAQAEATQEVVQAQEILREDFAVDPQAVEDANVVMVDAESLGFKKDTDVLTQETNEADGPDPRRKIDVIGGLTAIISRLKFSKPIHMKIGVVGISVFLLGGLAFWSLPKATVTVLTISQTIVASDTITIDPTATAVDAENNIVPGKSQEQSVSGEKTVAVEGTKNVGDPARGTVTIYNKSLLSKTYQKGTVLESGNLKFTLDSDVEIASASESVGSITFGKIDAGVSAAAIGGQSNLPGGSEFTFTQVSSSVAIARNESAFTGGTSREVTVVSRSDVDNFVKDLSAELTAKAQEELATSVAGGEQMIEGTIKTTVTERVFDKEINQEGKELQGKLTVTVSGVTYGQNDIRSVLVSGGSLDVPDGYTLDQNNTLVTLSNIQVKKDGTITAHVSLEAIALPTIDVQSLPALLAGKSMKDAEAYLRSISGVGGMQVGLRFSPTKSRLPVNRNNISVTMSTVE